VRSRYLGLIDEAFFWKQTTGKQSSRKDRFAVQTFSGADAAWRFVELCVVPVSTGPSRLTDRPEQSTAKYNMF
jgi:hypothetical protein